MSLDYIFGKGTSSGLDCTKLDYQFSKKTGRLRHVLNRGDGKILFTFRSNGSVAPTIDGARLLLFPNGESTRPTTGEGNRVKSRSVKSNKETKKKGPRWVVTVRNDVSDFVATGKTVFSRHVVNCDRSLRAAEDVAVLNQDGELLAVGKAAISGPLMKQFKRGVAVKVREGTTSRIAQPVL
jgi:predicted RNA-binding protein (TIGR00451 family)